MRYYSLKTAVLLALLLASPPEVGARAVSRDELSRIAKQQVSERLQQQSTEQPLTLLAVQAVQGVAVPDGTLSWQIEMPERNLHEGKQSLRLLASASGRTVAEAQVWVTLKQRDRYLVLRRALRRGEVVRADDLIDQEIEQQRPLVGYLLADQADRVVGQAAVRPLVADRPLQMSWFAAPQAIDRGGKVRVLVKHGAMFIETIGVAMANGRIGDTIEVLNNKSQRRFMAQVSGPSEVTVQF
ncbi:MAG: flagellar basal body P-ring formation protein FlgA [Magnetococcales bacterium]|nr:flagellar basal body P-ring formation protein FlgA [Magnetococcales bacterium]